MGQILYLLEEWAKAKKIFEVLYDENPEDLHNLGFLGVLTARIGNREEATRTSEELKSIERPNLHGENTHLKSCIAAILGDKEQAVELIRDSLAKGRPYHILHWDMGYENLDDYPPSIELKKPKG